MTKQAFLTELRTKLSGLPQANLEEQLDYYNELIDGRMKEGISEEEAVSRIGSADKVASRILADIPLFKVETKNQKKKRRPRALGIVLLVLSSPLFLFLWIAAFAVVLFEALLVLCVLYVIVMASAFASQGNMPAGVAALGAGVFGIGCSILMFFCYNKATKGVKVLTKKLFSGIKTMLTGEEQS